MLTTHGDDIYRYKDIKLNFSSNICGDTDLSGLKKYLVGHLDAIASYPEPEAYTLETMIAERERVDRHCVLVTNGATEAIYLLAQFFRRQRSTIAQPTFSEYETACYVSGARIVAEGDIVWICNPNNPTGNVVKRDIMESVIKKHRDKFYILDHAYEDYTTERLISDAEAVEMGNVAVLHSMTKQYGVPGLRLGYVVTTVDIANALRSLKQPWTVNALALVAGKYLIKYGERPDTPSLLTEAQRLNRKLNAIDNVQALPTMTNFMLCTIAKGTAAQLKKYLATKRAILIRDAYDFYGLSPHHFRVAAQRAQDDDQLIEAIRDYVSNL